MSRSDLSSFVLSSAAPLRAAAECINTNRHGIALVVDAQRRLIGTITDGDIRRAVLAGFALERGVLELLASHPAPVTAPLGTSTAEILRRMREASVRQLPLLDAEGCVADVALMKEMVKENDQPIQAVIMAGGFGQRLRPLTESLPKPMLPVGEKPMMELIINQLRDSGINKVNVTTHFEPEKIKSYFGDGSDFGVDLNYVSEESPLGTAGALSLMDEKHERLLVINGDILTEVDFRAMLSYHCEHGADLTVAVRAYDFQVPYGVIESDGMVVTGVQEKPVMQFFVNAGIYLLEPSVHRHIPQDQHFDMTDLIKQLVAVGRPVASFPVVEYWLDIGQHADYQRAQDDVKSGKFTRV
ncbi:MAG: nucleotidyltransferase family protein [Chthoniobacter sp.]|nr:nucleotidyltransferase family protein [Chthoniobacter sp.]